jgi:hypothetical protein
MTDRNALKELIKCFQESPQPSFKVTNYFQIYTDLFAHLRNVSCTFIETGILNGGSLFMWRKWLGEEARIIGIDLNPAAKKWEKYGFEIYIGDQGDPAFWKIFFSEVNQFDALLDDGGHQSFQQIVTLSEAVKAAKQKCVIAIEDTCTSFFKEFSGHHQHSFLEYAKDATDTLLAKTNDFFPGQFPKISNSKIADQFSFVYSVQFYSGLVAFRIDPDVQERPKLLWNHLPHNELAASDFRYNGTSSATIDWPNLFEEQKIVIKGGTA